jgi:cysteine desulfurase
MLVKAAIYLDANAGAPLSPAVIEKLLPWLGDLPNPSSGHSHGRRAKRALSEARQKIAQSLGGENDPDRIVFTSSGTEANQLVVRSLFESQLNQGLKPHWITTPVEHDSNLQIVKWLESRGGTVSYLPVHSHGAPQVLEVKSLIRPETALISAIWVNNETGVITDVETLAQQAHSHSIPLHLDAAQAWGKIPIQAHTLGAQFVTFSGHKIGALAGVGGVWVSPEQSLLPLIAGKQEKGRRGGTENILGIISMGLASEQIDPLSWAARVAPLRDRLQKSICERIPGACIHGEGALRVANTLNFSFQGVKGDGLIMALDLAGYSVSSGSACSSGIQAPSHVLLAMGKTPREASSAIRVSLSDVISWEKLEGFIHALEGAVGNLRAEFGR